MWRSFVCCVHRATKEYTKIDEMVKAGKIEADQIVDTVCGAGSVINKIVADCGVATAGKCQATVDSVMNACNSGATAIASAVEIGDASLIALSNNQAIIGLTFAIMAAAKENCGGA